MFLNMKSNIVHNLIQNQYILVKSKNYSDDLRGGKSRQLDKKANEYYIPVTDTDQGYVFD